MQTFSAEIVELEPQYVLAVRGEVPVSELSEFFAAAFRKVFSVAEENRIAIVGPPFGYYPEMPTDVVIVEAGFPVGAPAGYSGEVHDLLLPGGRALVVVHVGPFDTMVDTYSRIQAWMDTENLEPELGMWESYLSDPQENPDPATWETKIVWPVRGTISNLST